MHLCLSQRPCLQQLLQPWREEPRSPLSFRSCLARPPEPGRPKKQVVFADAKGLSLVSVHRFDNAADRESKEGSCPEPHLPGPAPAHPAERTTYALGFPPPGQDEPGFPRRLPEQSVCLERCAVEGAFLRGSVRARSRGVRGAARLRITFDAWGSFQEVPCVHQPGPGAGETHSYAFQVELPLGPPGPAGTIQFCFSLECAQQLLWDNNQGQNYCLVPATQSCSSECSQHIGSVPHHPRCSHPLGLTCCPSKTTRRLCQPVNGVKMEATKHRLPGTVARAAASSSDKRC